MLKICSITRNVYLRRFQFEERAFVRLTLAMRGEGGTELSGAVAGVRSFCEVTMCPSDTQCT